MSDLGGLNVRFRDQNAGCRVKRLIRTSLPKLDHFETLSVKKSKFPKFPSHPSGPNLRARVSRARQYLNALHEELLWKRIWTWTSMTSPFWVILAVWYIYNNWELPALGLSGKTDFILEKELDSIALNPTYGKKMFTDEMYRKIFKSECLKCFGLETGMSVYNQAVEIVGWKEKKNKRTVVKKEVVDNDEKET